MLAGIEPPSWEQILRVQAQHQPSKESPASIKLSKKAFIWSCNEGPNPHVCVFIFLGAALERRQVVFVVWGGWISSAERRCVGSTCKPSAGCQHERTAGAPAAEP